MRMIYEVTGKVENGVDGGSFLFHGTLAFLSPGQEEPKDQLALAVRVTKEVWDSHKVGDVINFNESTVGKGMK